MSLSRRLPRPEIRLLVRRSTGLELFQVHMPPLAPLALLTRSRDRAQLGGWPLMESARQLELSTHSELKGLLTTVLNAISPICLQRQCTEVALRLELEEGTAPIPWSQLLPELAVRYRYRRLTCLMSALRRHLAEMPEDASLSVAPLPSVKSRSSSPWSFVPPFPAWFGRMFDAIFTPGTDPEIAEAIPFQLALLELIMAAGWQTPTLSVLRRERTPVGMIVSRELQPGRGELSFVGLVPEARGLPAMGRALMKAGLEPLAAAGVESVVCAVSVDNPRSYAFFSRKWGFGSAGTEEVLMKRF